MELEREVEQDEKIKMNVAMMWLSSQPKALPIHNIFISFSPLCDACRLLMRDHLKTKEGNSQK